MRRTAAKSHEVTRVKQEVIQIKIDKVPGTLGSYGLGKAIQEFNGNSEASPQYQVKE